VLRRAEGSCEYCTTPAPFKTKQDLPYLEPHHIRRLSDGGPDDPRFMAALCPNCHRQVHYGLDGDQLNATLTDLIRKKESALWPNGA
jgi:5-methylcytosine-specific restriction enzyme A